MIIGAVLFPGRWRPASVILTVGSASIVALLICSGHWDGGHVDESNIRAVDRIRAKSSNHDGGYRRTGSDPIKTTSLPAVNGVKRGIYSLRRSAWLTV